MIFKLDAEGATLLEEDDLKKFHCLFSFRPSEVHLALPNLAGFGEMDGDDHVWLEVDQLCTLASDDQFRSKLDAVIDYARKHGWVRDDPLRLRGHIEWTASN